MATFAVNQNRQLYVVKAITTSTPAKVGDLKLSGDAKNTYMYFQHMGYGGLTRSDKIDLSNVTYAKSTKAANLARPLKRVTVTLDTSVNGGTPISGQDYILRVFFKQYIGNSDIYQEAKYGAVHAYSGMTPSEFYKTLALSLVGNFSREAVPLLKFYLKTSSSDVEVTATTKKSALNGAYTGVILEEAEQPWVLGVRKQEPVLFEVMPTTITYNGDDIVWGSTEVGDSTKTIKDGKAMADLEYFCMGERGDQYRNVGWPHSLSTKYLVDPEKEYDVIDLHYYFSDTGVNVHKSEKDITLLIECTVNTKDLLAAFKTKGITLDATTTSN